MAVLLQDRSRTGSLRRDVVVVAERAFPILDHALGWADVTEGQQGLNHGRGEGGGEW